MTAGAMSDTVMLAWLFVVSGALIAWLCIMRIVAVRRKNIGRKRKTTECVVLSLTAFIAVLAAVSSGMNAVILHHARALAPGRIYLVHGYRMHMHCMGIGSPTLILDAGLGNDSLIWGGVQPVLAKNTRVCAYDRSGWGLSMKVPGPQDANHIAGELHGLLDAAGINGSVVLMGHSIAGMYIRAYASRYPAQVAGLIFVDASTPLQDEDPVLGSKMPRGSPPRMRLFMVKAVMALGMPRWLGACSRPLQGFSPEAQRLQDAVFCDPHVDAGIGEMLHFHESGEETVHDGPYAGLPVLVLSSDPAKGLADGQSRAEVEAWERMQENLKYLSPHSRRIIARGSAHNIHLERPDLIERDVPLFLEQVRGTQPPPSSYGTTTTE